MNGSGSPESTSRRIDQWLWFARLANSRSLASRLCTAGAVILNGIVVRKSKHLVRIGDIIIVPQGSVFRTIRVKALGSRRGPSIEAQLLYEQAPAREEKLEPDPPWRPLLTDN